MDPNDFAEVLYQWENKVYTTHFGLFVKEQSSIHTFV